jgi:hypothetical protein
VEAQIDLWIYRDRDRKIVRDHLFAGKTYEQMAEENGVSVATINAILNDCKRIVFDKCEEAITQPAENTETDRLELVRALFLRPVKI